MVVSGRLHASHVIIVLTTFEEITATTTLIIIIIIIVMCCRRLLQMGVYNAELYNNLGLCCFYAQQYDMTLNCFTRALAIATDENVSDIWYNLSHVALVGNLITLSLSRLRVGSHSIPTMSEQQVNTFSTIRSLLL